MSSEKGYIRDGEGKLIYNGKTRIKQEIKELTVRLYVFIVSLSILAGIYPLYCLMSPSIWGIAFSGVGLILFLLTTATALILLVSVFINMKVLYDYLKQAQMKHRLSTKVMRKYRKLIQLYTIRYILAVPVSLLLIVTVIKLIVTIL